MIIQSIKMQNGALGTVFPVPLAAINQQRAALVNIWRGKELAHVHGRPPLWELLAVIKD